MRGLGVSLLMIIILYTPGNFGSTIEYCLRQFSVELTKVQAQVMLNGSMHSYKKEHHPLQLVDWNRHSNLEIMTPVFPNLDYLSGRKCLEWYQSKISQEKVILIDSPDLYQAERCQLFAYYKIGNIFDTIMKDKAQIWNPGYHNWRDMQKSELREALSFYIDQQHDLVNLKRYVPAHWHVISPQSILYDLPTQILNMLNYCGLTYNGCSTDDFYHEWFSKQKYILQEAELIDEILRSLHIGEIHNWDPLSIMGEAIIQSRLRRLGHELDMTDLNALPSNTLSLRKCFLSKS
jgi:hypothetical protein